jgi:hypothetical protein
MSFNSWPWDECNCFSCMMSGSDCGICHFTFQIVEEACTTLMPNELCKYLYKLAVDFMKFYDNCKVLLTNTNTFILTLYKCVVLTKSHFGVMG